jgi:CBS domain-containing protein
MKSAKVKNARKLITEKPTIINQNASLKELVLAITEDGRTRSLYVVDEKERLQGIITLRELIQSAFVYHIRSIPIPWHSIYHTLLETEAKQVMSTDPVFAKDEDDLEAVLNRMLENEMEEIPVVDDEMKVIGELNLLELLTVWLEKALMSGEE